MIHYQLLIYAELCKVISYIHTHLFSLTFFPTEDGGVTLNGAKVVKTIEFDDATTTGVVHEMDGFVSPSILWRYADQREFACIQVWEGNNFYVFELKPFYPRISKVRIPGSS